MKRIYFFPILISILVACQIEDDNAPTAEDAFIKYYGNEGFSYTLADLGVIYAGEEVQNFIILGTQADEDLAQSIYVAKTDPSGFIISERTFSLDSTNSNDVATKLTITGDTLLVLGNTSFNGRQGIVWTLLNLDLNPIANFPNGRSLDTLMNVNQNLGIRGSDIIKTNDNNFVIVGNYDKTSTIQQYFRTKISASNLDQKLWFRPPDNVPGGNGHNHQRVFEESNDDLVLIGNVRTISGEGEGGLNVSYIKTNSNGVNTNGQTYGLTIGSNLNANDLTKDAVRIPGGFAITGTSSLGNEEHAFAITISSTGILFSEDTISTAFLNGGVPINTNGNAITQGITNDLIIVGQYPDFRITSGTNQIDRSAEIMFIRTDQSGERVEGLEANYGLESGEDVGTAVLTLRDGKIVIGSTVDFGSGVTLISLIKLNDTGQLDD